MRDGGFLELLQHLLIKLFISINISRTPTASILSASCLNNRSPRNQISFFHFSSSSIQC